MKRASQTSSLALASLLGICSMVLPAFGLNPSKTQRQYVIKSWRVEDGLPQNSSEALAQTPDGFVWIGTEDGLARLDGHNTRVYNRFSHKVVFEYDHITVLFTDRKGTLWVGTEGGGLISHKDEEFTRYTSAQGLGSDFITSITDDVHGQLWIGTKEHGFTLFDGKAFSVIDETVGLVSNRVSSVSSAANGDLWVGTDAGMCRYRNGRFELVTVADGLPSDQINVIYHTPQGTLWVGTDNGLAVKRGNKFVSYGSELEQDDKNVMSILQDKDKTIWFGAKNTGMHMIRDERVFLSDLRNQAKFFVMDIMEDREGSIWSAAQFQGTTQYIEGKVSTLSTTDDPSSEIVVTVLEGSDGYLYLGTSRGLYSQYGSSLKLVPGTEKLFAISLAPAPKMGGVWVGTEGQGVVHCKDGVLGNFVTDNTELHDAEVRGLLEASDGRLWIGTRNKGVSVLDGVQVHRYNFGEGQLDLRVSSIHENESGIYFSTSAGLVHYDGSSFVNLTEENDFEDVFVVDTFLEKNGTVWATTLTEGILVYKDGHLSNITRKHGLPDDKALSIIGDGEGTLWVSNNQGLFAMPVEEALAVASGTRTTLVVSVKFDESDGMLSRECNGGNQHPVYRTSEGVIWLGCMAGAVRLDANNIFTNTVPPTVSFLSVEASGKSVVSHDVLKAGTSQIEIRFEGISFMAPEAVRTKHRLVGFDDQWSEESSDAVAFFTNLGPGDYSFEVVAKNADDVWSTEPESFHFSVAPFFWQTRTFIVFAVILAILLILVLAMLVSSLMNRRRAELSRMARKQSRSLLEGQVESIRELTGKVSAFSSQLHEAMNRLASSSGQVASSVEEAVSTVAELEQTGVKAEDDAKSIVGASEKTQLASEKGRASSEKSSTIMVEIKEDAQGILVSSKSLLRGIDELDAIVLLIKTIVNKTRILSTNAAIESAKVGHAGRGFGVIAEKMKDLAEQSKLSLATVTELLQIQKQSAEMITQAAAQGRGRTEEGVITIADSSEIVAQLGDEVSNNSEMAHRIATTINQQIVGLNYIQNAMAEIRTATTDNKSISHEVVTGSGTLNEAIAELLEVVDRWQTPEFYGEFDSSLLEGKQLMGLLKRRD